MGLWQDVQFAVRLLVKNRWFTIVAAMALALGIGVNTAVFTFVNAVLIRGLPFSDPDRIIAIRTVDTRNRPLGVSRLDFNEWHDSSKSFAGLVLFLGASVNVSEEGRAPELFQGVYQSANLFQLIGVRPILGRDFRTDDDQPAAPPVAIIGGGMWKNRYGGDPTVIGRAIKENGIIVTIVGIMPPDMRFPLNADIWMPLSMLPPEVRDVKRNVRNFQSIGRLAPGVTLEHARAEFLTIGRRMSQDFPDSNKEFLPQLLTYNDSVNGPQITLIFLSLMGAVGFVLLIACANVANLLLSRAAHRSREIAIRVSLGAGRWRIIRQLLVESMLLSFLSGVIGLGLSIVGIHLFDAATTDVGKPYWMTFSLDPIVFGFLLTICVASSVLFGLAPALHVSKTDVHDVLKDGGGRSGSGGMRTGRWTNALIVIEIVLTLVLLAGAGFMIRSFMALYTMDLRIDTSRLLTMQLALPLEKYPHPDSRTTFYLQLEGHLETVSAIQGAAITTHPPAFGGFLRQLSVDGQPPTADHKPPDVTMVSISAGYFDTLGIPIQRGRMFVDMDGTPGHDAVIVNQRFVTMHLVGGNPIGRRIRLTDSSTQTQQPPSVDANIVGVVPTVRQRNFQSPDPDPVVYVPYRVDPQRSMYLLVRGNGDAAQITSLVREQVRVIEPDLPLFRIQTMDQLLSLQRGPFRVFGSMFAIFAVIALILSAVGLYAVTAYSVTQRMAEIGVRMALGAQPKHVMWLFVRRTLIQLALGIPIGLAGALGVGRLLRVLLVQTSSRDPVTIGSITFLILVVSLAACCWAAHRATRLDPISALRYE